MKKLVVLALSGFFMWSCNSTKTEESHDHDSAEHEHTGDHDAAEHATEGHEHDNDSTKITLIDGQKWVVNEEMKPYVSKGEDLLNNYVKGNKTDYKALATSLKEENNKLIKSCTMDGKSHDELHKWLHPHLALVGELENAADASQAQTIVSKLVTSYGVYHLHFN